MRRRRYLVERLPVRMSTRADCDFTGGDDEGRGERRRQHCGRDRDHQYRGWAATLRHRKRDKQHSRERGNAWRQEAHERNGTPENLPPARPFARSEEGAETEVDSTVAPCPN